jgi:hypothetical protein
MNLISITCSTSPAKGYSYDEADEMLDLFGTVLTGRATAKTIQRMLAITGAAQPITASMRKAMRPVRLSADQTRPGLAGVSDKFWKAYKAKHPQREPNRQPIISTMRRS